MCDDFLEIDAPVDNHLGRLMVVDKLVGGAAVDGNFAVMDDVGLNGAFTRSGKSGKKVDGSALAAQLDGRINDLRSTNSEDYHVNTNAAGFTLHNGSEIFGNRINDDVRAEPGGFFAAGDVREKQVCQIVTAVSDGAVAATMAARYIGA